MGNTPKVQTDADIPVEGTIPAANADGRTPLGIPEEAGEAEPKAKTTNDRLATETAALNVERDKPEMPKR